MIAPASEIVTLQTIYFWEEEHDITIRERSMNRIKLLICFCLVCVIALIANPCFGQDDSDVVDNDPPTLADISKSLSTSPKTALVRGHLPTIITALRNLEQSSSAIPIAELSLDIVQKSNQNASNLDLIELLNRETADAFFENGDLNEQKEHLTSLQDLYDKTLIQRGMTWRNEYQKRSYRVLLDYLRTKRLDEGFGILNRILNLPLSQHEIFDESRCFVAAALNRQLNIMNPDERFELLLNWTFSDKASGRVRTFTSFVPVASPPSVFARAIRERPKERSFSVASVGPFSAFFSTEWELVQSAVETGRLRELSSYLDKNKNRQTARKHSISTLVSIANQEETTKTEELLKAWQAVAGSEFAKLPDENNKEIRRSSDQQNILDDLVIVAAILNQDSTNPMAREILKSMERSLALDQWRPFGPYLRRATAESQIGNGSGSKSILNHPNLKHWIVTNRESLAAGERLISPIWLSHESHLLQLTGQYEDFLCLRYPITGDFSFHCEAQAAREGGADGNLAYNGRSYSIGHPGHHFSSWRDIPGEKVNQHFEFIRTADWPLFQQFKIVSDGKQTNYSINRHPAYTENLDHQPSPWLALRCSGNQAAAFRNIQLGGDPVISDKVLLSSPDSLTGWYGDVEPIPKDKPSLLKQLFSGTDQVKGWRVRVGIIQDDLKIEPTSRANQSQLTYFRPLLNEERLSYEFFYEPGKYEVHPAMGRLAFLLAPKGVMIHWITKAEDDWTGLRPDNSTLEPLNSRGPRPLQLKDSQWNHVELHLQDSTLQVHLNSELIYTRKMEPDCSTAFSFFHDRNRSAVRVKNVQLRGDWSKHREKIVAGNLLEPMRRDVQNRNRSHLSDLFHDIHVDDSAFHVHQIAMEMEPEARYVYLKAWVLPNEDHRTFRLALDFARSHPPGIEVKKETVLQTGSRVETGGELICPAGDLVETARQLGRLEELRDHAIESMVEGEYQQRCRLAMLAVLHQELEEFEQGSNTAEELIQRVEEQTFISFSGRWPETFLIAKLIDHPHFKEAIGDLAIRILDFKVRKQIVRHPLVWERHLETWVTRLRFDQKLKQQPVGEITKEAVIKPANWSPATKITAWSRGKGMPAAEWKYQKSEAHAVSNLDNAYLFFHSPLRGDFEVECEIGSFNFRETHLCYAGQWIAPYYALEEYEIGNFRDWFPKRKLDRKMSPTSHWIRCRMKIKDRHVTTWFNGQLIHEEELPEEHLPWLAARCYSFTAGGIRDMRVTGNPDIPDKVRLSVLPNLDGWVSYEETSVAGANGHWRQLGGSQDGGMIVANRDTGHPGQVIERLLYCQRPMFEDGTIEYEFYYNEGRTEVHPALDRHVFVLTKEGVRTHWLTDHDHERTLTPLNLQKDSDAEFLLESLPLKQRAWNRLRLQIIGDAVELTLNGEKIYRGQIAVTNQRYFGLFHYGDQTNVKVRKVVWKGEWPKVLPDLKHQRFVDKESLAITEKADMLPLRFDHDFRKNGYPVRKFSFSTTGKGSMLSRPDGLHMKVEGGAGYSEARVSPKLVLQGDYDLVVKYHQLKMEPELDKGHSGIALQGVHFDKERTHCTCVRGKSSAPGDHREIMLGEITRMLPEGNPTTFHGINSEECTSGRLRLIRSGDRIHYFLAEGESPSYRLISSQLATEAETLLDGVRLRVHTVGIAKDGQLKSEVVWERLTIRAEKANTHFDRGLPSRLLDLNR